MTQKSQNPFHQPAKSTNVRSLYKKAPAWITGPFAVASRVAPDTTASVAARLFFATRRTRPKPGEREVLQHATPFRVGEMAAWQWGRGPVILLVHGWNGRATQLGGFVAPLVERGYRVVAFDAPGHGESAGKRSSLPEIAEAIERVAHAVGGITGVVAHSMGGAATAVAMSRGLRVQRAVFISPPSDPEQFVDFFTEALGIPAAVHARVLQQIESRVGGIKELRADRIAPRMSTPLLIVHDRKDTHVPVECGKEIASAWPGAQLVTTEGLGHQRILRDDHVQDLAVGFIDAQARAEHAAA